MSGSIHPPSCAYFSNAWLPVCSAGEDRYVWVNPGMRVYRLGIKVGKGNEEAVFSR